MPVESSADRKHDPDPLVIDLIVGVAASGAASLIAKVGKTIWGLRRRKESPSRRAFDVDALDRLRAIVDRIDQLTDRAFRLIEPNTRRVIGGILLLSPDRLREYDEIREELFAQIRQINDLTVELFRDFHPSPNASEYIDREENEPYVKLPGNFTAQVRFLENRLQDARTATLAEEALIETKSAITTMRRMLDQMRPLAW